MHVKYNVKLKQHFNLPQLESLWTWIVTLLEIASNNFTVETVYDWGNFFMYICVGIVCKTASISSFSLFLNAY